MFVWLWLVGCGAEEPAVDDGGPPSVAGCSLDQPAWSAADPTNRGYVTWAWDDGERLVDYVEGAELDGVRMAEYGYEAEFDGSFCVPWEAWIDYRWRGDGVEVDEGTWVSMRCEGGVPLGGATGDFRGEDASERTVSTYTSEVLVDAGWPVYERQSVFGASGEGWGYRTWTWSYRDGQLVERAYYDEVYLSQVESFSWEGDRLTAYEYEEPGSTHLRTEYTYDDAGHLLTETEYNVERGDPTDYTEYEWSDEAWYTTAVRSDVDVDGFFDSVTGMECTTDWPFTCTWWLDHEDYTTTEGVVGVDGVVDVEGTRAWSCPEEGE